MKWIYYIEYIKQNESKKLGVFATKEEGQKAMTQIFLDLLNQEDAWKTEPLMKDQCGLAIITKGKGYFHLYSFPVNQETQETINKMCVEQMKHNIDVICNGGFDWERYEIIG